MTLSISVIQSAAAHERDRLQGHSKWRIAYEEAEPEEPLLVRAETAARDYYIVQFRRDNRTTGLMLLNSLTGRVGAITGIQASTDTMFRFLRPNEVRALLDGHDYAIPLRRPDETPPRLLGEEGDQISPSGPISPFTVNGKQFGMRPTLYWVPCDQSLTPFQPLYVASPVDNRRLDEYLLVRVDGQVYTSITHGAAGM